VTSLRVPEDTTRAVNDLARAHHTTVNTVLQAAFAQLLCWLTGQHDVAFGAVVSGRPAELPGAEAMVGLLINTVPVRATFTAATTTADLLNQLGGAHNQTLDHQHLALSDIHRVTGHQRLFDTVFVFENYPTDAAALSGTDGLAITELTHRDYYHYPLAIQALPGAELELRVQFRTDVFDAADIDTLIQRFIQVLVAMAADPARPLSSTDPMLAGGKHARLDEPGNPRVRAQHHDNGHDYAPPTRVEQILTGIYSQVLGLEHIETHTSFFDLGGDSLTAMQAITAINTTLETHLALPALINTPSIKNLSQQIGGHANTADETPTPSPASDG
jgi:non-ribosomal peptide synthetase component F